MLKKQLILTGFLTAALFAPAQAKAWITVDVTKATGLISALASRYQPIATTLERIEQVKETKATIDSTAKAAMAGDLKSAGKTAAKLSSRDTFSKMPDLPFEKEAKNGASAKEVSDAVWDTYFFPTGANPEQDQIVKKRKARRNLWNKVQMTFKAKSMYFAMTADERAKKRMAETKKAQEKIKTVQDAVNAGTMLIMSRNFEMLNQVSWLTTQSMQDTIIRMNNSPFARYVKPEPPKFDKEAVKEMGDLKVKDEADVDLQ